MSSDAIGSVQSPNAAYIQVRPGSGRSAVDQRPQSAQIADIPLPKKFTSSSPPPHIKEELSTTVGTYHHRFTDPDSFENRHRDVLQSQPLAFHKMKTEVIFAEKSFSPGVDSTSLVDSRKSSVVSGNAYLMGKSQSVLLRETDEMPSREIEWYEAFHPLPEDLRAYSKDELMKMTNSVLERHKNSSTCENKTKSLASTLSEVKSAAGAGGFRKGDIVRTCAKLLLDARNEPTAVINDIVLAGRSYSVHIFGSTRGSAEIRIFSTSAAQADSCLNHHRSGVIVVTRDKISRLNLPLPPTQVEADFVDSFFEDVQTGLTDSEVKQQWIDWFMEWAYRIEIDENVNFDGGRSSALIVRIASLRVPTQLRDFKWKLSKLRTLGDVSNEGDRPDMRQIAVFFRDTGAHIALHK